MSANWIKREWEDLCERLRRCADARDCPEFRQQTQQFVSQTAPGTYQEVLDRVREAANLATAASGSGASTSEAGVGEIAPEKLPEQELSADEETSPFDPEHGVVDALDEAGMETFPASDPSTHY